MTLVHFDCFPSELQHLIFAFLDLKSLAACSRACKSWERETKRDELWRQLFVGIEHLTAKGFKTFVRNHNLRRLNSELEIPAVFELFCQQTGMQRNGTFKCQFPLNKEYGIEIQHKYNAERSGREYRITYLLTMPLPTRPDTCRSSLLGTKTGPTKYSCHLPQQKKWLDIADEVEKLYNKQLGNTPIEWSLPPRRSA
jgi:hypothetical protein